MKMKMENIFYQKIKQIKKEKEKKIKEKINQ